MVIRTSLLLIIIIIVSKITGFIRDTTIAYVYGVSSNVDAYFIGQTIPSVIFGIIGSGITTTLLPIFVREEKEKGAPSANQYLNVVLSNVGLIVLLVIGVGIFSSQWIVKAVAPGFAGEKYALAVVLTMIGFPSILFTSLGAICTARLQSMSKFIAPSLIGITANIVLVVYLFLFNKGFGIHGFMVATVISYMTEILVMMPVLLKSGWRFKFTVDFKHPLFKKMVILTLPVLIGTTVDQINVLVDRMLASNLVEGSISALNYAYRLNALVTSLFAASIGTIIYYSTSSAGAEKDNVKLQKQLFVGLELILLIGVPIAIGLFTFAEPIVRAVFERGTFSLQGSRLTASALMFYSIGILGIMVRDLLSRTFYSLQETKTPMMTGIFAVVLNIILSLILVNYMEIGGLALASALSLMVSGFALYLLLHKKIRISFHKRISLSLGKSLAAGLVMIVPAKGVYQVLTGLAADTGTWRMVVILCTVLTAGLIYLLLVFFMKFEVVEVFKGKVRAKFGKHQDFKEGAE